MNKISMILIFLCIGLLARAEENVKIDINGQVVAWSTAQFEDPFVIQPGARFVPTLTGKFETSKQSFFDFEASLNINGSLTFEKGNLVDKVGQFKPYRIWGRYANDKIEVRAGLQKINFGSAKMFRPLMWFDGMDIRDPLQLTDGVYGILSKYFFDNNSSVWLWGLVGNDKPKGYELYGSALWKPEVGGRFESPIGPGEIGLGFHHRTLVPDNNLYHLPMSDVEMKENRIGVNGKWDLEVGLWFESSISFIDENDVNIFGKTDMLNVGMDYTLPIGNGLGVTFEYFRYHTGNKLFTGDLSAQVLGGMLNYPVSLMDNLSGMLFYLPVGNKSMWLNYLSWSRNYDNLSLYAIAFWNPVNYNFPALQAQNRNLFAGKGLQLMVSYNF
ncbi:hypothetical protein SDC9_121832 [bioreactor metagenome]|uniref:Uncharacterized protein n=1 Tax=bioreactor metagenome TaxID=1076179 RepID=A0A645CD56_9ZZZZ